MSGWLTRLISVDTCTDMFPENKPRYVMGIVWHGGGHCEDRY